MMKNIIKPVRNKKDYADALEKLSALMDAEEGTLDADERDVLSILIEKYEQEHFPIPKPSPVEAIKFRMEQAGLTQNELIPYIGSRSKVSEVLSGKKDLTLKMIRALHNHLGIPAEVLIRDPSGTLPSDFEDIDFDRFPIIEMEKNGAFRGFDTSNINEKAEEAIRYLIKKTGGPEAIPEGLFRKTRSARANAKLDPYALQGWSLHLLAEAKTVKNIKKYKKENINNAFLKGLASLSILDKGPDFVEEYLANGGIIFKLIKHLKNTYLDGASFITMEGVPVIGLTRRYNRIDNFWFTLFHEIAHVLKHLENGHFIADDMTLRGSASDNSIEKEADNFAEKTLLGTTFDLDEKEFPSQNDVIEYAKELNIHPAIIAGHIQYKKNNYRLFSNLTVGGDVKKCFEDKK